MARRRDRAGRRGGRDGARRLRDRLAAPLDGGRPRRGTRLDAASVRHLARHPPEPRGARRARARGARTVCARGVRAAIAPAVRSNGRCDRHRDPRQCAARAPTSRTGGLRRLADRPRLADGDGHCARRRHGRARRRTLGRAEQGAGRLLRDHNRCARPLEGEQPEHAPGPRRRRLDRRRTRAPGSATLAGARGRSDARRNAHIGRRVRADAALPRGGHRLLARRSRREGVPRRAGHAHALEPGSPGVGFERERHRAPGAENRRADVHDRPLRPGDRRLLRGAAAASSGSRQRCSRTTRSQPWSSPEARGIERRGTSCSRSSPRSRSPPRGSAFVRGDAATRARAPAPARRALRPARRSARA